MKLNTGAEWQTSNADIFWGEIAACEHVVQIYEQDAIFLDSLAGFVGGGINSGDCVIVIATKEHLQALDTRLNNYGIQVDALVEHGRYIPLDAEKTLAKFMVDGWPDETLFMKTVSGLLTRAKKHNTQVRAFGEMVALLWAKGCSGATVQLEHLWNKFCETEAFSLFCAYPKAGFTDDIDSSLKHICCAHSKMITSSDNSLTQVTYRNV
ncbi:MAG: hypothetical protein JWN76_3476 [Chitinophagaceae bacterium]|nr:hypothetical protein [Chitinophagaceae bacterium]